MMEELDYDEWDSVARLFAPHILARSLIFPCMKIGLGSMTVDDKESPKVAIYSTPLMIFVAGNANSPIAQEIVRSLQPYILFIAYDDNWKTLLKQEWGKKLVTDIRTHLDHSTLDIQHLKNLKNGLGSKYILKKIDIQDVTQIKDNYSIPIRLYFGDINRLVENGLGFCILHGERVVSLAYTPFPFIDEFEIQVYTEDSQEYRGKGLATVVSAALLEYGLKKGLVPHWDAANKAAVKLALKLGYSKPRTWEAYYRKE